MDSYLVLLRMGFTIATTVTSRAVRSYRTFSPLPGQTPGGFLSVALSVGSHPPGVTWHPDLRSPDFPPSPKGDSGRLISSLHNVNRPAFPLKRQISVLVPLGQHFVEIAGPQSRQVCHYRRCFSRRKLFRQSEQ